MVTRWLWGSRRGAAGYLLHGAEHACASPLPHPPGVHLQTLVASGWCSLLPKRGGVLEPGGISQGWEARAGRRCAGAVLLNLVSPVPRLGLLVLKGAFIRGPCTALCGPGVGRRIKHRVARARWTVRLF